MYERIGVPPKHRETTAELQAASQSPSPTSDGTPRSSHSDPRGTHLVDRVGAASIERSWKTWKGPFEELHQLGPARWAFFQATSRGEP